MSGPGVQIRTSEGSTARTWTPGWWLRDARWLAFPAVGLAFAGHLANGAQPANPALSLAVGFGVLVLVSLCVRQVRDELGRLRGLRWPAAFFGATLLVIAWSMTPYAPGGPHPVWRYVGLAPGATTLDKAQTLFEFVKLVGLGAAFAMGCVVGASDARARAALNVTLAFGAAMGFADFLSFAGGAFGPGVTRLGGPFEIPNTAATLFGMLLVLAVAGAVSRGRGSKRPFSDLAPYAAAALIFAVCLLATQSRGGFAAAAAGLVVFAVLQTFAGGARWTRATLGAAVGIVLVGAVLIIAGGALIDRLGASRWDIDGRRQIFDVHWRAFRDAPWMGYGLGSFDTLNVTLLDAQNIQQLWKVRAAHNVYLSWLEQTGIIGATPMFLTIAAACAATLRGALRRSRLTTQLFALIAVDVLVLAHGATDFALEIYSVAVFWSLLLGLQFAASQGSRR